VETLSEHLGIAASFIQSSTHSRYGQ